MANLLEVKATEDNKGVVVFNVDLGLTLTDVTIEYNVTLTESGYIITDLNRMVIKNQKGEYEFVSDGNHGFKGVGRGRKPNTIIDIATIALDMVETEMILGSFNTEIINTLRQTEVTETVNTTVTEEVTYNTSELDQHKQLEDIPSNTDNTNGIGQNILTSSELDESRDDEAMENVLVDGVKQQFTSANTSINKTRASAIYSMNKAIEFMTNRNVIDIGGGKYDIAIEKAKEYNATVHIYDKYNRSSEHNDKVLSNTYDVAVISNVLNVISELTERKSVVELALSKAPIVLITVYEGNGSGIGKQTGADSWQENRKTIDYMEELKSFNPKRYGKLIVITR